MEPVLLREPGGTAIGERIRSVLLDSSSTGMCPETELLLMVASRAQLVRETIRPALEAGRLVICDRFADASVAYQGGGRELGPEVVHPLNEFALGGLVPDLTFLCLLPPEEGRRRLVGRETNRLDHEALAFHRRVHDAYRELATRDRERFRVIDASDSPEGVLQQVLDVLASVEHKLLKHL